MENAASFALVFARVGGLVLAAPVLGSRAVPSAVKIGAALALAALVTPGVAPWAGAPAAVGAVALAAAGELALGLLWGFAASLILAAVPMAGRLVDQDAGLALARVVDPMSGEAASGLEPFHALLGAVVWLAIQGHHALIAAVMDSFRVVPLGGAMPANAAIHAVAVGVVSRMFALAVQLAAPALVALLLVTIAAAALARAVPDLNVLVLGAPVRVVTGVAAVALALSAIAFGFARAWGDHERALPSILELGR
ncbi:MAG: flagellar biosynthetic protein FliR [Planctomycetes bacterium]|nr:flagellar biosynthetic protein FliR [Planctomycetota bacterium]